MAIIPPQKLLLFLELTLRSKVQNLNGMKNIKRLTVTGFLLLMFATCKKAFLEITPAGPVSEQTLQNAEGVNGLLIGAYSLLDGSGAPGGGTTSWWHAL